MAAMMPRTGDGPREVTKEGRGIVMRVPLEGGGRLVVELNAEEAGALGEALTQVVGGPEGTEVLVLTRNPPAVAAGGVRACAAPQVRCRKPEPPRPTGPSPQSDK